MELFYFHEAHPVPDLMLVAYWGTGCWTAKS